MSPTRILECDDVAVVALDDFFAADGLVDLRWQLHDLVVAGARTIVIDFSRVTAVRSDTLAALLGAHRACRARGGGVLIRSAGKQVTDLMYRTGLRRVFTIEQNRPTERSDGKP